MLHRNAFLMAASAAALGACSSNQAVQSSSGGDIDTSLRWNATLGAPANLRGSTTVTGTAWVMGNGTEARAHIDIANAQPGARLPWSVRRGHCSNDLGYLGPAQRYPVLEVGSDGKASTEVTIPLQPQPGRDYSVDVMAAQDSLGTVIACGDLTPPTNAAPSNSAQPNDTTRPNNSTPYSPPPSNSTPPSNNTPPIDN